jgi:hypothetical protein
MTVAILAIERYTLVSAGSRHTVWNTDTQQTYMVCGVWNAGRSKDAGPRGSCSHLYAGEVSRRRALNCRCR